MLLLIVYLLSSSPYVDEVADHELLLVDHLLLAVADDGTLLRQDPPERLNNLNFSLPCAFNPPHFLRLLLLPERDEAHDEHDREQDECAVEVNLLVVAMVQVDEVGDHAQAGRA